MTITTDVTFHDLKAQYDDELADHREAYEDTVALITDEYGADAVEGPPARHTDDEDARDELAMLQATAAAYNESGKSIQQRVHVLERLAEEYDGDTFTVKMLSGAELSDIETEVRMRAQRKDTNPDTLESDRQMLVADAATVDAPDGVPTNEDGPVPSECPNPLPLSLYETIERLNQTGATDFRAPGFGDADPSGPPTTSGTPTDADALSSVSDADAGTTPHSGEDS